MFQIKNIRALEVIDSRGTPTLKVSVDVDNGLSGSFIVPSGASTGKYEAKELRDGDARYFGKGVENAVTNVNEDISSILIGLDVTNQKQIDSIMLDYDATSDKSKLGANAILGVSIAVAKAAAKSLERDLYLYIRNLYHEYSGANLPVEIKIPIPMFNVINGGQHAENNLSFQEFIIVPSGIGSFKEQLRAGVEIDWKLGDILKEKGLDVGIGDEGGYAPSLPSNETALDLMIDAIKSTEFREDYDIKLGIDVAASQFYNQSKKIYTIANIQEGSEFSDSGEKLIDYYVGLLRTYPFISIEDGFGEDDWESWQKFKTELTELNTKLLIIGDDLTVTNKDRVSIAKEKDAINAIIIKPNQIGTLSEVFDVVKLCRDYDYKIIVSHRSGDTEDTFMADLAVGLNAEYIKDGAPKRGERTAKYNRLLEIEAELNN